MIIVRDVFEDIVKSVSNEMLEKLQQLEFVPKRKITGIYVDSGKQLALIEELLKKTSASQPKYPLFVLFQPFTERYTSGIGTPMTAKLNCAVLMDTGATDKTERRYDNNYKPILYPLLESFLKNAALHPNVTGYSGQFEFDKSDNPYWSNPENKSRFNEPLDAIEFNITLNFKTLKKC